MKYKNDIYKDNNETKNNHPNEDFENDWNPNYYGVYVSDTSIAIRMCFLRRVYLTLSLQLLVTITIGCLIFFIHPLRTFVQQTMWLNVVLLVCSFLFLFLLMWKQYDHPINLILFSIWIILFALTIGISVSFFDARYILEAIALTCSLTLFLTLFTFQSKIDFSFLGFGLIASLWILFVFGLLHFFFPLGSTFHTIYCIAGAIIFCLFIVFDTYMIIHKYSIDDWIPASISLYLDIINLFLYVLELLSKKD